MNDSPAARLKHEKERARALLADGYAEDLIDQSELDRRLEAVEHAVDVAEVHALTAELRPTAGADAGALLPVDAAPERLPVLFGSLERAGAWTVAPRTHVRVLFGSAELDLRQAQLPPGPIELTVTVVFGSLDITIPPGWRLDNRAGAILGSVDQQDTTRPPAEGARLLRISGRVVFGSLSVHERLPGEGSVAAWKRRRQERKALADASRRALPGARDDDT